MASVTALVASELVRLKYHWFVCGPGPPVTAVNVAAVPHSLVALSGPALISGSNAVVTRKLSLAIPPSPSSSVTATVKVPLSL